ncbi:MAG: DUF2183 domain-containing protein [Chloroflexi bacterium]|nr:DUF2183 domain-containing protein [Chloroflexota bacterium]
MSRVLKMLTAVETRYDSIKFKWRQHRGLGKLLIMPFIGYGTAESLFIKGRVLRDKNISEPMATTSTLTNLIDTYKRFQSDEIPRATIRASFGDYSREAVTNEEGFFEFELQPGPLPVSDDHTYLIDLEIRDYPGKARNPVEPAEFKAQGQVIVPPDSAQFGVISDIDDTVLMSNVAHPIVLARNTFLENAHTRLPFEGVAKLYQALRRGADGSHFNPVFYVSSSAWNIYDVLRDFFVVREIPTGALFLSEYNLDENTFIFQNRREHKIGAIETIMKTYPQLKFVLIGDSSEKDPLIYREITQRDPQRIQAIYIRTATLSRKRDARLQAIVRDVEALGVPIMLVKDSVEAAEHAVANGLIHPDALPAIRAARNEDKQAPTPVQQVLGLPATPENSGEADA